MNDTDRSKWGAPAGAVEAINRHHPKGDEPPEDGNAWGQSLSVSLAGPTTFVDLRFTHSRELTVWAQVISPAPTQINVGAGPVDIYVWIKTEWGNGSAAVSKNYRVGNRIDVSLMGSYFRVSAYFGDSNGVAIPYSALKAGPAPVCLLAVYMTRGQRGAPYTSVTRYNNGTDVAGNTANFGIILSAPAEVISFHCHFTDWSLAGPVYLQFYDMVNYVPGTTGGSGGGGNPPPLEGTPPFGALVDEFVIVTQTNTPGITAPAEPFFQFKNPMTFRAGVAYFLSSQSGTQTTAVNIVGGAELFITIEVLAV